MTQVGIVSLGGFGHSVNQLFAQGFGAEVFPNEGLGAMTLANTSQAVQSTVA